MKESNTITAEIHMGDFTLKARDPFGFLTFEYTDDPKKVLPKELEGHFSGHDECIKAHTTYQNRVEQQAQMAADKLREETKKKAQAKAEKELAKAKPVETEEKK